MADLDHSLSLADALTEPPPQIEEEVKRDFMATLEAEKFDDVVGETVGKTDYVPLLDDDDVKAGNQEAKTKPHVDSVPVERTSATGPAAVVENGDHAIEGSRKVSPGKIMDDQISYKEFLDHNNSWKVDERDRCFDPQPAFKPTDVTEPFKMHREDVLSDLLLLPQEMTSVPAFGDYFGASSEVHVPYGAAGVPGQPPLGPPHSPANVFDPLAFLDEDLGAETLLKQNEAVPAGEMGLPEDFWLRSGPIVETQETPFFEPPVPSKIPDVAEMHLSANVAMGPVELPGEPKLPEAKLLAPAGSAGPASAVEELMGFEPCFDHRSLHSKEVLATCPEATMTKDQHTKAMESAAPAAGSSLLEKQEDNKPSPSLPKEKESSSQSPSKQTNEAVSKSGQEVNESKAEEAVTPPPSKKAEEMKPSPALYTEARESDLPVQKVEESQISPSQPTERVEENKAPLSQPTEEAASKPLVQKVEEHKPSPSQPAEKVEESKVPPSQPSGKQEENKPPSSPSQPVEPLPMLEELDEKSKKSPSKPAEKQEEQKHPPAKPVEHFPELAESEEPVPLGEPQVESRGPFPGKAAFDLAEADKSKEAPEPRSGQPAAQLQEKASREPAGFSTTRVRQANKSSDRRRFARTKPFAETPEELAAHFPAQKSRHQGEGHFSTPEYGCVAGTSPQSKAAPRKVVGQLFDLPEGQKDVLQETWDLEASAAFKKKKKKPKQKRSQQSRSVESWEEAPERLRTPLCDNEPRKSDMPLAVPAESSKEVTSVSTGVLRTDTSKREMEWQLLNAQSPALSATGEPIQYTEGSWKLELNAKAVEFGRAEVMSEDRAKLLSKSRKKGSSKEQMEGHDEQNKPGSPTSPPAQAGEKRKLEGQPPSNVGLDISAVGVKPTVSSSVAVTGEATKAAGVDGKLTPEDLVPGSGVLEGEPKQQGGDGKGGRAGKEAASSPSEGKTVEVSKERKSVDKIKESCPVVSEPAEAAKTGTLSGSAKGSCLVPREKPVFGSLENPFSWEAHSDPVKPLVPAETLGGGKVPFPETSTAACSSPSEKPAVALPRVAADQPKKRSSDGKSKKPKHYLEQQLLLSEDTSDPSQALALEEVAALPETASLDAAGQEVSCSRATDSKAVHSSAGVGEKPKKRGSDGKSRKAAERSSFGPPVSLLAENTAGSLPVEVSEANQMRERALSDKEARLEAARQSLEIAADTAEQQVRSTTSQTGKQNVPLTWKDEWAGFPSSAYPFIMEIPSKVSESPTTFEADAQPEGTVLSDKGKGPSSTPVEGSLVAEPSSMLLMGKPKKKTSDGRSKKSGKNATEEPEPGSSTRRPSKKMATTKEMGAVDKGEIPGGDLVPLEQPSGSQLQSPAIKLMERTEGKKDEDSSTVTQNSCSEQPPASARKMSPVKPEPVTKTKDVPSTHKGQEVSLAALEHLAEAITSPKVHSPLKELAKEEPKFLSNEGQGHPALEAKLDTAASEEEGQTEKGPLPTKAVDSRLKDAEAASQAPPVPLVDETSQGVAEETNRKSRSSVETQKVQGAEIYDKPKGHASDRCSSEAGGGSSDLTSRQDPSAKPAKRGSDGKSKKVPSSSEQPLILPAKAVASQAQHPKVAGPEYGLEETEFVDENRNIKNFPPGHQMLWGGSTVSSLGPFGSPGPSSLDEASFKSQADQCPFLKYQSKGAADIKKEQIPPPEMLKDPSRGKWNENLELQEDSAMSEVREAMLETSLLVKAGDKTREKRKKAKTKQSSSDHLVKQDAKTDEDRALSPVLAGGGGVSLVDKTPSSGLCSSESAAMEEKKMALVAVAGTEVGSSAGREAVIPPAELPALWENKEEAAALHALTAALVGGRPEPGGSSEGLKADEQGRSDGPDKSGSKAGVDKASEDVPTAEAASANKPQDHSEPGGQGDVDKPVICQLVQSASKEDAAREAAEQMDTQGLGSTTGSSVAVSQPAVAESHDQVTKESKREERARAPERIKGYMRPTKSRGLPPPPPPPPLRVAAQEPGKRRPAKPDGPGPHRQERAKPEETKAVSEELTANDIAAPPKKELPPSPEKKTKPSASTPAKPAAAKTKPVSAAAAPAKRPASTTPGQNKKATSPTAGPAAATTPKRPVTSTTRPSTLTPKDAKPKGSDAKSVEKRTSPSKPLSATTPRSSVKSSPATPRPTTGTNAAAGPRSAATSPPKRPSTIKTDTKLADAKKTTAKSPSADLSRPKSAPASTTAKISATTPTAASSALPGAATNRPKPTAPRLSGTASTMADSKKASTLKAAPKTSPASKPSRPPTSASVPDLKNIRSKIGSTDNIKHQPGGGKAKVERKAESAGAARKPELNAVSKTAVTKEGPQKQPNGKVQIVSKKANYSHVQSKCGSKDNIKHVPGGGNVPNAQRPASGNHSQPCTGPKPSQGSTDVQILNKKIDLSKVSSKCGSKANIKHKPGGGDVKIENQKLNFKEKAQAKVGSLDNVGHVPAGGTVKTEGGEEAAPQNGAVPTPLPGSSAAQENGVGLAAPAQGSGDQMEIQSFDTHIQETN
ncbi:microtubule-associated protein 4 isoform X2 [Eublepharis macularius]|uniref:Microtubule-associated protein n=1 Tax=Eublepharis macularius TaxID=481883 RepID=A0AA97LCB4_EUBMA|nr:microtubule-associated protein 4 isoform X2 [Eublepharis macularius]